MVIVLTRRFRSVELSVCLPVRPVWKVSEYSNSYTHIHRLTAQLTYPPNVWFGSETSFLGNAAESDPKSLDMCDVGGANNGVRHTATCQSLRIFCAPTRSSVNRTWLNIGFGAVLCFMCSPATLNRYPSSCARSKQFVHRISQWCLHRNALQFEGCIHPSRKYIKPFGSRADPPDTFPRPSTNRLNTSEATSASILSHSIHSFFCSRSRASIYRFHHISTGHVRLLAPTIHPLSQQLSREGVVILGHVVLRSAQSQRVRGRPIPQYPGPLPTRHQGCRQHRQAGNRRRHRHQQHLIGIIDIFGIIITRSVEALGSHFVVRYAYGFYVSPN